MTGRQGVVVLVLAGVCSVVVAAVLSVTGVSDWRVRAGVAAAAAIATFAGGIALNWLTAVIAKRVEASAALDQSVFAPGGKPPLVRDVADPVSIGVHAAARRDAAGPGTAGHDTADRVPDYVARDVDPALHRVLARSGFVLVTGDAAAGKTRTAYEAMRAVLPGHVFIVPSGTDKVAAAMARAHAERDSVLWLDSLQRFFGAGGVTSTGIAELLAGDGHHRVVLATLRASEESRLTVVAGSLPGTQLIRDARVVLDQVSHRIVLDRLFSPGERARTRVLASSDHRLADALGRADRYGIPEYLSSGPQLRIEWANAWERGTHPRGAALTAAAVDCRRAGFAAPLPRTLLDELQQDYLDRRGGMLLRPESLTDAWAWATELRDSGDSPLLPAGPDSYEVFDYLVDVLAREPAQLVPEQTIRAALRFARPADAGRIGVTAWYQDRPELAEAAFRAAYTELLRTDGPEAPATLASRSDLAVTRHAMGKLPEAEYRQILAARTEALGPEHPDTLASRNNLATVLHTLRRLPEAEAEYRAVRETRTRTLGSDHPDTLLTRNNLGVVLNDLGRLEEAEAELADVLRRRTTVLGPDHPHTVISRENLDSVRRKRSGG